MEKADVLQASKHPSFESDLDLNSMPGSVVIINKHGRMVRANASWNEVLLRNHIFSHSISNDDYFDIRRRLNQNDTFEAFQGINRVLNGEEKRFTMGFYCNLEMRHFEMDVSSVTLKDNSIGALISHQVKQERVRQHAATAHCNKAIFEAFPEGVVIFDYPSGQIREANQSFCHFIGYTNKQLRHLSLWDITPVNWIEKEKQTLESKLSLYGLTGKQGKVFETKSGASKHTKIQYKAIKENGVITSAWAIIKDLDKINEESEKALEAQRQQSIGQMTNGITHELNNILSIILANTEMLDLSCAENEQALSHTQNIVSATHRASKLISEISSFNKSNGSEFEELDMLKTVSRALKIVQAALPPNITLTSELAIIQPMLLGNASQLQQALLNLTHFIIQALGEQVGKMHIDLQKVGITGKGEHIAIQVGCSKAFIAAEDIDNVNAFYLLGKPHKNLTLSTLSHILHNHHGSISAFETRGWHWVRIEIPIKPNSI
ncbi:PAS domain S-box protein [Alteromonas sp. a30]|uniref:PAS domain S-box protein n=1 Tax=Alteromonas sp. a30 TaxID=2730917 RepID=UPI002282A093|nr:PAS domain S-box protein [Alteromonas sp. a30]MCY7296290.1 PAS domain S-box protein [Alteromonas sp. a30]